MHRLHLVIIHEDSGERRLARFITGAKFFSAKVIYEAETELSPVASRQIGPVELERRDKSEEGFGSLLESIAEKDEPGETSAPAITMTPAA